MTGVAELEHGQDGRERARHPCLWVSPLPTCIDGRDSERQSGRGPSRGRSRSTLRSPYAIRRLPNPRACARGWIGRASSCIPETTPPLPKAVPLAAVAFSGSKTGPYARRASGPPRETFLWSHPCHWHTLAQLHTCDSCVLTSWHVAGSCVVSSVSTHCHCALDTMQHKRESVHATWTTTEYTLCSQPSTDDEICG